MIVGSLGDRKGLPGSGELVGYFVASLLFPLANILHTRVVQPLDGQRSSVPVPRNTRSSSRQRLRRDLGSILCFVSPEQVGNADCFCFTNLISYL